MKFWLLLISIFTAVTSTACSADEDTYIDVDLFTSFLLNEKSVDLITYKAPTGIDPNVERYGGYLLVLDDTIINDVYYWIGAFRDNKTDSVEVGLHYRHKGKVLKELDTDNGFFSDYQGMKFAVLHDSGQHDSFSTLWMIWHREEAGVDYRKLYVVNGSIAGAQVINNKFVISGVELDKPFARIVRLDGSTLFIDELPKVTKH